MIPFGVFGNLDASGVHDGENLCHAPTPQENLNKHISQEPRGGGLGAWGRVGQVKYIFSRESNIQKKGF